ncbi:L,D-transpeptidase family protein [Streptomyces beihaiensis]|uniref:L,D-transpeptidase family protein n=1 Tax=Streptomyces beihaiensis TaxID=2984495 RepID=A0ABT3TZY3_9ACTN|nr:L,D-transpeptidase family protein [Streptomyces beihaiensis]MCX3062618.1 L,D-transpeptidase family protein [Streptomyces beihaiensis]
MRGAGSVVRAGAVTAAFGVLLATVGACGADGGGRSEGDKPAARERGSAGGAQSDKARTVAPGRIPGVGERYWQQIPDDTRQAVVVYGDGKNSGNATIALYTKSGGSWKKQRDWSGHNGKKGWTTDHHEGDRRSPVGVFTLSDAGGVLADPGAKLPYTRSAAFRAPRTWSTSYWHDFDYVIAIDYNRVKGTPPNDPTRPQGQSKGGGIWLHMDHGSGTSGCVSQSRANMAYLLKTLDPAQHPVVVMGDKADLQAP